jgi:hypothetical protein
MNNKLKIIELSDYTLAVSNEKIKESNCGLITSAVMTYEQMIKEWGRPLGKKIIAYQPKGNAPELDLPLLPIKPTKSQIQKDVIYNYNKNGQATAFDVANSYGVGYGYCKPCETDSPQIDGECLICNSKVVVKDDVEKLAEETRTEINKVVYCCSGEAEEDIFDTGFVLGYKAATKKYSEEDLILFAAEIIANFKLGNINSNNDVEKIIQSLKQPIPTWFVAEMEYQDMMGVWVSTPTILEHCDRPQRLKTTTKNGKTYLVGKFIYE